MGKNLSEDDMREVFRKLHAPGSPTREIADWHASGGTGPVPRAVRKMLQVTRIIPSSPHSKADDDFR